MRAVLEFQLTIFYIDPDGDPCISSSVAFSKFDELAAKHAGPDLPQKETKLG